MLSCCVRVHAVVDDTDHDRITAGSLITLSVTLYRTSLLDHCGLSIEDLVEGSEANKEITPVQDGHIPDDQVLYIYMYYMCIQYMCTM